MKITTCLLSDSSASLCAVFSRCMWSSELIGSSRTIADLSLIELRQMWTASWGKAPTERLGRTLLETSLTFKLSNSLTPEVQNRLDQLIKTYKRNAKCFDERCNALRPGTQLIRSWKGKKHTVLVKSDGFDFQGKFYTSLSQIANDITGTRWNGHLFFGLKKKESA